jgi:uncharacterized protein
MIKRQIENKIITLSKQYPVITITGPRQSGKTTLCKNLFRSKPYVSLEAPDIRRFALKDPNAFLKEFPNGAVLDEIQKAPQLLSYIQTIVDEKNKTGLFILTGSSQFELISSITQSLAGRTAIIKLLPFSFNEIYSKNKNLDTNEILYKGFYPRIFDKKLNPTEALSFYTTTYLERDIRDLINIKDVMKFNTFLKVCAGRTGQILNLSSIGNECGLNHNTIKSWISVLEASYIIFLVKPYYRNFNKRLIKSPKLYFIDVGLACSLLEIENKNHLKQHPLRGALFETFVVSEFLKSRFNRVQTNNLYYFRDNTGNEVDLILDYGDKLVPIEIKSGETITDEYFKNLNYYSKLSSKYIDKMYLIYAGDKKYTENNCIIKNYEDIDDIIGGKHE